MTISVHKARHGLLAHYAEDRVIGQSLRHYGEWAEEEIHLVSHFVRPGDVVLDIGANVGSHAVAFGRMVGETGRVIAIEGQSRASDVLALNIRLNGMDRITRIEGLIGRETRVMRLDAAAQDGADNLGCMSFRGVVGAPETERPALPVPLFTADCLALPACRLMKIDVEGMELDVLLGAQTTIARHRPVIYFEQTSPVNFAEIVALLRDAGYGLRWHVANPFNRRNANGYPLNIFGGTCEVNVLAVPQEHVWTPPPGLDLRPVEGDRYDPPPSPTGLDGWSLPEDAYAGLPPVLHHAMIALPEPEGFVSRHDHEQLELRFRDLERDRIKAQEIMDHQARIIAGLQAAAPGAAQVAAGLAGELEPA
ncbi:methyltransferase, FkbM family [Methylobacterium sp. 174MFSha1.1]|uniref:FkbM family methyltransferase n=1 Tax=Methylobacterium sp. 174MFSha1.1 TaxID=1502749 RepID=UPI0008F0DEAB|nr:FkbM family methyltransferase [Methylobacterium sp. 174MFSha1.1]SFU97943.1 methyltransferase, FkbM family [Methylobacterium sp. 174MFSha1.1]